MHLHFLLACAMTNLPGAAIQPARPNLKALICLPTPLEKLPAKQRIAVEEHLEETTALCRYLNRVWNRLAVKGDDTNLLFASVTAIQQFDSALQNLNPNPTVMEAIARVRAYRVWFTIIQRGMERARAKVDVQQLQKSYLRAWRFIDESYCPLFARSL